MISRSKDVKKSKNIAAHCLAPLPGLCRNSKPKKFEQKWFCPKYPQTTTSIAIGNQTWMAEEPLQIEIDEIVNGKNIELNAVFFLTNHVRIPEGNRNSYLVGGPHPSQVPKYSNLNRGFITPGLLVGGVSSSIVII